MSLRALAQELYALEKEAERLRREFNQTQPPSQQDIELKLLQVISERDRLRAVIQMKKEHPV